MKGKLNSWYIRWAYHAYKKNLLTVYPKVSFVNSVGHDNSGVHCSNDPQNIFSHTKLNSKMNTIFIKDIKVNQDIVKNFNKAFNIKLKSKIKKLLKNELV